MKIPSGKVDRHVAFVAVDPVDLKTRKTGLSGFTVYRTRNNGAVTAYTTPTVVEVSAGNAPGLYWLLVDEDTTIAASSDSEEYVVHITHASMRPVTHSIELYRRDTTSGRTLSIDASSRALADMDAIKTSAAAATTLSILNGSNVVYQGTVTGAATTTTSIDSGLTQADTDWWKGRIIIFTSVIPLQATDITAFNPATDQLTFTATTQAPTGATYVII